MGKGCHGTWGLQPVFHPFSGEITEDTMSNGAACIRRIDQLINKTLRYGSTRAEAMRYKLPVQRARGGINKDGFMHEYAPYYGTACIIFSFYLLIKGFIAASRQRSEDHSTTLVPAYVYGILASILLTVGLGFFRPSLPWWGYRLIFPGTTILFPAVIYFLGRRPPKPNLDRVDA